MDTLFNTTEEFIKYMPIDANFSIERLWPSIHLAEERYLSKILGTDLYNTLLTNYQASNLATKEQVLLDKCLPPLAHLSILLYTDINSVNFNEDGLHITTNENQKTAFEWQVNRYSDRVQEIGYAGLDAVLQFLEEKVTDYPTWKSSDAYAVYTKFIIKNAVEFQECYNINSSRLTFLALLPKMEYVEDFIVGNKFCGYWDELKTKIKDDNLTVADEIILPYLKKSIARYTIANGLDDLSIEANVFGVIQWNKNSSADNVNGFTAADENSKNKVIAAAEREADLYLQKVITIMQKNISDYPTYAASDCYDADGSSTRTGNMDEMRPKVYNSFFRS